MINDFVITKGKNLSSWKKRKIKEKIRRYCRDNGIDLLIYTSE